DASAFYDIYYKYESLSKEDWLSFLKESSHQAKFLPAMNVLGRSPGGSDQLITYSRSIPFGEPGPSDGAVVILLDAEQIGAMLSNLEGTNNAKIFIADREGRMLARSDMEGWLDETKLKLDQLVEGQ